jgi:hypothetical protein
MAMASAAHTPQTAVISLALSSVGLVMDRAASFGPCAGFSRSGRAGRFSGVNQRRDPDFGSDVEAALIATSRVVGLPGQTVLLLTGACVFFPASSPS